MISYSAILYDVIIIIDILKIIKITKIIKILLWNELYINLILIKLKEIYKYL